MIIYVNKTIPKQPPEKEYGNKEYKRFLFFNNENKRKIKLKEFYEKRASQMLYRLCEGRGKALYLLGIEDDGKIIGMTSVEMEFTLNHLKSIVNKIDAKIKMIRAYNGGKGYVCSVRIFLPDNVLKEKMGNLLIY